MKDLINKDIILYFLVGLLILVYGLSLVIPEFTKIGNTISQINQSEIKTKELEIKKQQKDQQLTIQQLQQQNLKAPVRVFKSIYPDMTIENSSVELVDKIVKMMQETENNITEISYTTDTIDPAIKAKLPTNFHVLSLKLTLDSSYLSLQNFFKKMYAWEYLYNINTLTLKPSAESKGKLTGNMDLWLYIEK